MADGTVVIGVNMDISKADKKLGELKQKIQSTQSTIDSLTSKKSSLEEQFNGAAAAADKAASEVERMKAELEQAQKILAPENIKNYKASEVLNAANVATDYPAKIAKAEAQYEKLNAKLQNLLIKNNELDSRLASENGKLEKMVGEAESLQMAINKAGTVTGKLAVATNKAQKQMAKFVNRVKRLAQRVLIFSVITMALRAMRNWMSNVIKTNEEAASSLAQLKGALLTMAQPLVDVLMPAMVSLVNILTRVVTLLAQFFSAISGKTVEQSRQAAEALYEETEALDGVGDSAKKAGKSMAGFDQINQLSGQENGGSSEIGAGFSGIQGAVSEMEAYMSGALLAIGALLAFSGINIPLGLGLMAVGAVGLASALSVNWDTMPNNLKNALTRTMLILSGAALAIGAILTFAVPGHMALGIGLMIAGAAALGTAVALNWNSITEALNGPIGTVTAIISGALLALGAIIAFSSPAHLALGIGLMAAGAAGLATVVALNWGSIAEKLRGELGGIAAITSAALLALGIILLFSGAGAGLGIGLILAGAAGLATVVAVNWNFLTDKVKQVWSNIKSFWNQNIAPVFTKEWWTNLAKNCGNGLLSGFESAVNGIIGIFEKMINWIISGLNKISFAVPDWVPGIGGRTFGFNIPPVTFGRVTVPRLATGAVVPPNREFMAVLGDNKTETEVVSPLSTMKRAMIEALRESGSGTGGETVVVLELDGREFGRAVYNANRKESNRIGLSLSGV